MGQKPTELIFKLLSEEYPEAKCALHFSNAYELLVATILSAQCTDVRVNMVTPHLFKAYPNAFALAKANLEDVKEIIKSTGFFNNKAKNLVAMANGLVTNHQGNVPNDLEALTKLPGVGRKTANVVLGNYYNIPSLVVDTHVKRISNLIGLTNEHDPEKIEADLCEQFPKEEWTMLSHLLIHHGRKICIANRPKCNICPILELCDFGRRLL